MDIMRGAAQLGAAKAGDVRPQARAEQPERPAFELPAHDEPAVANGSGRASPASSDRTPAPGSTSKPSVRERTEGTDDASSQPDPMPTAQSDAPRPAGAANASRAREAREPRSQAAHDDVDAPASPAATQAKPAAPGSRRSDDASDPESTSLPDRMLALLSADPLPAPVVAAVAAALPAAVAITTAPGANPAAAAPSIDPAAPAAEAANAMRSGIAAVAAPAAAMVAPAPTVGTATATSAPDAFAALAALAGRTRDGAAAPSTGANPADATGSGFAPQLVQALDALQGAPRALAVTAPVATPLMLDVDFDDGLGARVVWMAEQRIDHAQIRVSPEALGPIDVRLQMDGHRVTAQFHAANADVRQALESGMDRLRDMLGRQGMELGQAHVGGGSRQGADGRTAGRAASASGGRPGDAAAEPQAMRVALRPSRGLLDEYA